MVQTSLCKAIDWNDRLICIKGPKGTGKTTLILQHTKETFGARSEKAVYLALDHLWFSSHDILAVVDWLYANGYTHVFLDEVHHAENWQSLVMTICDFYPNLNIVYSGSSILELTSSRADLSRRQAVYALEGLSFREFLQLEGVLSVEAQTLADILKSHREIADAITDKVKILPLSGLSREIRDKPEQNLPLAGFRLFWYNVCNQSEIGLCRAKK